MNKLEMVDHLINLNLIEFSSLGSLLKVDRVIESSDYYGETPSRLTGLTIFSQMMKSKGHNTFRSGFRFLPKERNNLFYRSPLKNSSDYSGYSFSIDIDYIIRFKDFTGYHLTDLIILKDIPQSETVLEKIYIL